MENCGNGGTDTYNADPAGSADLPLFEEQPLSQLCQQGKSQDDENADTHKYQVFLHHRE